MVEDRSRVWPEDRETYYGAFVRNPDGNNVEAVCRLPADRAALAFGA